MSCIDVSLSGADEKTDLAALCHLANEYPEAEFAILYHPGKFGSPRYPSPEWLQKLWRLFDSSRLLTRDSFAIHLCGTIIEDIVAGKAAAKLEAMGEVWSMFGRVQLNGAGPLRGKHRDLASASAMADSLRGIPFWNRRTFIVQVDGVHDHWLTRLSEAGFQTEALFDRSCGRGVQPGGEWPWAFPKTRCGYAGGLSLENLEEQIPKILNRSSVGKPIWIDMESSLRTMDLFDLSKSEAVLKMVRSLTRD